MHDILLLALQAMD